MKTCRICQQIYSDNVDLCPRDGARLGASAAVEAEPSTLGQTVKLNVQALENAQMESPADKEVVAARMARAQAPPPIATVPDRDALPAEPVGQPLAPGPRPKSKAKRLFSIVSAGIGFQVVLGVIGAGAAVYAGVNETPRSASEAWVTLCNIGPFVAWLVLGVMVLLYALKSSPTQESAMGEELTRGARMATTLAMALLILGALNFALGLVAGDGKGWSLFWCSGPLGVAVAAFLFSRHWASQARRLA
jgi:hypothetical protein